MPTFHTLISLGSVNRFRRVLRDVIFFEMKSRGSPSWPTTNYFLLFNFSRSASKRQIVHQPRRHIRRVRNSGRGRSGPGFPNVLRPTEKLAEPSRRGHGDYDGTDDSHRTTGFVRHRGASVQRKVSWPCSDESPFIIAKGLFREFPLVVTKQLLCINYYNASIR